MNSSVRLYYPSEKETEQPHVQDHASPTASAGGIEPTLCRRRAPAGPRRPDPRAAPCPYRGSACPKDPAGGCISRGGHVSGAVLIGVAAKRARSFETEGRGSVLAEPRPTVDSSQN
jgi:hypothetical protein